MIYHTRAEYANHYTTDAVLHLSNGSKINSKIVKLANSIPIMHILLDSSIF